MIQKFRNTLLMLIIALFSFHSFGYVIYFLVERENIKEKRFDEIERNDPGDRVEILTFDSSDYEAGNKIQRINNREIRFQGKMYDIVKIVKQSGITFIYCIHDEKEDKLEKEFADNIGTTNSAKMMMQTRLRFISQMNYVEPVTTPELPSPIKKCIYISASKNNHSQRENEVPTPPPQSEFV